MLQREAFPQNIPSPLDPQSTAILIDTRPTSEIADQYLRDHSYDCAADFEGLHEIAIYECQRTGYRFFYPFHLEGKERLYRTIEGTEWRYEETKWEFETVAALIADGASVLDIGSGRGAFLSMVKSRQKTGIELNRSAAEFTRQRGIDVAEELIADHAKKNPDAYDVITAFQVLEHIADPLSFLNACVAALRPGGLLAIAVPNNDTHLRFVQNLMPLNQPPHHVGLWGVRSLSALPDLLPINLQSIMKEPLRELEWYRSIMEARYLRKGWKRSLYYRLGGPSIVRKFIAENAQSIAGHTVIGLFSKRGAA